MFKAIKYLIGLLLAKPGAKLWEIGGYPSENYDELKWYGKLGYNLMMTGFKMTGITMEKIVELANTYEQIKGTE